MKYSSRLKKERILQGSLSGGSSLQTYSPHNHFSNWFGLKQKQQQQQQQHNIYVCLMVFVVYFALFSFDDETKHEGAKTICRQFRLLPIPPSLHSIYLLDRYFTCHVRYINQIPNRLRHCLTSHMSMPVRGSPIIQYICT